MATPINFFRGDAPYALTVAYTVPESNTAIVTNIVAANPGTAAGSVTVKLGGVPILPTVGIAQQGVLTLEINQVLAEGEVIEVQGSGSTCTLHVSGVEVV
ncbi:hypothetical protein [Streptomyces sp. STCH 565 A]|uniref:hypothetical protein n=1 Tax=Streptomyces sp. STCH 565 A TaxID=2950532 RepID=UPI0020760D1D|nr:hypothetical protein [Streptomyces sp. STCH 565 A]MCM8548818.1 hypothetical protein [Streptomyces sp. STCH 565 A]